MKTIIFVCHGNICRSVAAEYIAKEYLKRVNISDEYNILSRAVTLEEIGNDIYYPMKEALKRHNIPFNRHQATLISNKDYNEADLIYYMDEENKYYLERMLIDKENKIKPITMYNNDIKEIEDPWYTHRFDLVISEIKECVMEIFKHI